MAKNTPTSIWDDVEPLEDLEPTNDLYFIGSPGGYIKIGRTTGWRKRLIQLQSGSPIKLECMALLMGAGHAERAYHKRFAAHRIRGEWFLPHPAILAEIKRIEDMWRLDDVPSVDLNDPTVIAEIARLKGANP